MVPGELADGDSSMTQRPYLDRHLDVQRTRLAAARTRLRETRAVDADVRKLEADIARHEAYQGDDAELADAALALIYG